MYTVKKTRNAFAEHLSKQSSEPNELRATFRTYGLSKREKSLSQFGFSM